MDVMINSKLLVITPQRKYVFRVGYFLDKILIVSPPSFKPFFYTQMLGMFPGPGVQNKT